MRFHIHSDSFAILRLPADAEVPPWASAAFSSVTRTVDELSVVVPESRLPESSQAEGEWRLLQVDGPLDLSQVGILASLASPLAAAGISIFALSTFDTDYVMVRDADLERAVAALEAAGHLARWEGGVRAMRLTGGTDV